MFSCDKIVMRPTLPTASPADLTRLAANPDTGTYQAIYPSCISALQWWVQYMGVIGKARLDCGMPMLECMQVSHERPPSFIPSTAVTCSTLCPLLTLCQVTFQCKSPDNAQELSLKGISAFDAAIHCASVSAAERAAHSQRNGPHHAAQSPLPAAFSPSTPPPISPSHQTTTGPSPTSAGTATHPPSSTLILPAIVSHPVARNVVSLDYSSRSAAAGAAAAGRPGGPRAHSLDQGPLTESQWGAVQEGRRGNGGEGRGSTWGPDPGLASGEREGTEDNKPSQKLLRMGALRDFFRRMFVTE
ncbi:hypothetical protein QJQ45_012117 [Haematococcus lacustris]|nr:hypothetical protein QJQ45_012117 [Haematococcus lacustris]